MSEIKAMGGAARSDDTLHAAVRARKQRTTSRGPWAGQGALPVVVVDLLALVTIVVSTYETRAASSMRTGLPWLNLAVGGVALSLAANARWFFNGREMVSLAEANVVGRGRAIAARLTRTAPDGADPVATIDGRYFHRATCALVDARPTTPANRLAHEVANRVACPICQP